LCGETADSLIRVLVGGFDRTGAQHYERMVHRSFSLAMVFFSLRLGTTEDFLK
jgi:hypothetical protein